MEASIILAKIFSLYLGIMAVAMIVNPVAFRAMIVDMLECRGSRVVTVFFTLVLGIILFVFHNYWVLGWPVVITVLAWLTLIKGMVRLFFPGTLSRALVLLENNGFYYSAAIFYLLLAIYLFYYGFIVT